MRISTPNASLRAIVLDPHVPTKHRIEALNSLGNSLSLNFLRRVLRLKKNPATLTLAATVHWQMIRDGRTRRQENK